MLFRATPLIAGMAPLLGVSAAYWLGIQSGILPACIPPLEGCLSISAAGRYLPGSLAFHAVMLPQALLLIFFWFLAAQWLRHIAPGYRGATAMLVAGVVGAVALLLYVTFLGTHGPFYEFMRRFGIYFYFLGTASAQLALGVAVLNHARRTQSVSLQRIAGAMLLVSLVLLVLGAINFLLKSTLDDSGSAENRIEWLAALALQAHFFVVYLAWRETGFNVHVTTDQSL